MSENSEIFEIITAYFTGEISDDQKMILNEWLTDPQNKKEFKAYAKANFLYVSDSSSGIKKQAKMVQLYSKNVWKFAAVFLLLLAVGLVWKLNFSKMSLPNTDFVSVAINGDFKIIDSPQQKFLLDGDGAKIASMENGSIRFLSAISANEILVNVPNGKNTKLLMSDGSEILLNAGTQLSFNSKLTTDNSRKVTLKGQAYFEIAKDKAHPFYVVTEDFITKVLGTKFNISSYKDENEAFVNLVEGKIEVSGVKVAIKKILTPGEKISFSPKGKISNIEAADPLQDMDWLNKEIAFDNNTTDEVLSKIERVYGLQIVREDVVLENSHFSGTFKIENLDQITHSLELLLNCKIQKEGNKLVLNPNK